MSQVYIWTAPSIYPYIYKLYVTDFLGLKINHVKKMTELSEAYWGLGFFKGNVQLTNECWGGGGDYTKLMDACINSMFGELIIRPITVLA